MLRNAVLIVDTETTGLSAKNDRIVEIAAVEAEPRTGISNRELHHVVNPHMAIPARATAIHGITDANVATAPAFEQIADELLDLIAHRTVVAHNASFDVGMIDAELVRCGRPTLKESNVTVVDSLEVCRALLPSKEKFTLDEVCTQFGISLAGRTSHGALIDVKLLASVMPMLAQEYDIWEGAANSPLLTAQTQALREISTFTMELIREVVGESAESTELLLRRLTTLMKILSSTKAHAKELISLPEGKRFQCFPGAVVKYQSRRAVAWKSVCDELLPDADLSAFTTTSQSATVKCTDVPEVHELVSSKIVPFIDCADAASAVLTYINVGDIVASIESSMRDVRQRLLDFVIDGYEPQHVSITESTRRSVSYKSAAEALCELSDYTSFKKSSTTMRIQKRDRVLCERLFGLH